MTREAQEKALRGARRARTYVRATERAKRRRDAFVATSGQTDPEVIREAAWLWMQADRLATRLRDIDNLCPTVEGGAHL